MDGEVHFVVHQGDSKVFVRASSGYASPDQTLIRGPNPFFVLVSFHK